MMHHHNLSHSARYGEAPLKLPHGILYPLSICLRASQDGVPFMPAYYGGKHFFFAYLIKAVEMQNFCFERGFPSFSSLGMFLFKVIFEGRLQSFNSSTSASVRMYH